MPGTSRTDRGDLGAGERPNNMTTILMLISLVPDWVCILILFTICLSFLVR
jgi:hypothetical protein